MIPRADLNALDIIKYGRFMMAVKEAERPQKRAIVTITTAAHDREWRSAPSSHQHHLTISLSPPQGHRIMALRRVNFCLDEWTV
jgi:hypothetical protein